MSDQPPQTGNYMQVLPNTPKVFAAISAITGELSKIGIAKDRENKQQGYNFRGIDQVYNVLAPLLAKHKLNVLPQVQSREERQVPTKSGGVMNYVVVKVTYAFVSAEDASMFAVTTYGEGMDTADKATNKAFSAAYKYAVIQAFAIPVEGQPDADEETPDVAAAAPEQAAPAPVVLTDEEWATLKLGMKAARIQEKKILKYFQIDALTDMVPAQFKDLQGFIKEKLEAAKGADQGKG